jgi:hypothetical protein
MTHGAMAHLATFIFKENRRCKFSLFWPSERKDWLRQGGLLKRTVFSSRKEIRSVLQKLDA